MTLLKERIRLNGAVKTGALAKIDQAVQDVRVSLYDEQGGLGLSRVNELLAIAYAENAATVADLSRTRANNLEVKMVSLLLLRRMPMLFMDASAETLDAWNEEHFSHLSRRDLRDEIERLEREIIQDLGQLLPTAEDVGIMDVIVFEPDETPPRPGASIIPGYL